MNNFSRVTPDTLPTKKQLEALRQIARFEQKHGRFPTQRELSALMGLSENGAFSHLQGLIELGFITEAEIVKVQKITPAGMKWVKP